MKQPAIVKLPRAFYRRPTLRVARDLLGKLLMRRWKNEVLVGKIVEVEAYLGEKDHASHAYRGLTRRNEVMFSNGGHLYVYFTYGMHFCCNVVTEREGLGRAVLIRAVEPLNGLRTLAAHRGFSFPLSTNDLRSLGNGPAKLCQAFGIGRSENGLDLLGNSIWIGDSYDLSDLQVARTRRVGIKNGSEHQWRFHIKGNPFVSPARLH